MMFGWCDLHICACICEWECLLVCLRFCQCACVCVCVRGCVSARVYGYGWAPCALFNICSSKLVFHLGRQLQGEHVLKPLRLCVCVCVCLLMGFVCVCVCVYVCMCMSVEFVSAEVCMSMN